MIRRALTALAICALATIAGSLDEGCTKGGPEAAPVTSFPEFAPAEAGTGLNPRQACEVAAETVVLIGQAQGLTCQEIRQQLETLTYGSSLCALYFGDGGVDVVLKCP